jgi:hypothetical protein
MRKIVYLFILISFTACGQTATNKINTDIRNSKSSKQINIPGTRLYIIPPPGFEASKTFLGFKKGENSMIDVFDLIGGSFYTNAATFSKEEFEKKGAKVFDFKEIKVNGYPAKFISVQGDAKAKSYELVFGDSTFSTMIMAIYPVDDEKTGDDILNSLNSIYYDKKKKIDPLETANFSIDENVSKFKFFQYNSNLYFYTINGRDNSSNQNAPVVLVYQLPKDNTMTAKSIAEMMISKSKEYGFTNPLLKNISTEKINGYDTYQIEEYGQLKGINTLIYYCVTTHLDKAIAIQGIAKSEIEANLSEFKKLAQTVKIK